MQVNLKITGTEVKAIDGNGETHISNVSSTLPQESGLLSTAGSSRCKAGATLKTKLSIAKGQPSV
ncbi:hypothetical protein P4S72_01770 [Vibrio sp. PP-XX7]